MGCSKQKVCEVCGLPISPERLQMQPRVITCSPACARENQLRKGRVRAKRHYQEQRGG